MTNATTKSICDAEGRRVAKENSGTGAVTVSYVLSLGGDQLDEINGSGAWQHSNIFAMGRLYATYGVEQSQQTTRFHLTDWLGTRRIDLPPSGSATLSCFNYPYGDGLSCGGTDADITGEHFTGKLRDSESGNDYFGARYYASNMGRWMSPDQPFADQHPGDPQSWNLYVYALNNPVVLLDEDGREVLSAPRMVIVATESVTYWTPIQTFDISGFLGAAASAQAKPVEEWRQNQSTYYDNSSSYANASGDQTGGCVMGCATSYEQQAVGIKVGLTFTYKDGNVDQAYFEFVRDDSARFIGPDPPRIAIEGGHMPGTGGLAPPPSVLSVNVFTSILNGLSRDQLLATKAAVLRMTPGDLSLQLLAAILNEIGQRENKKGQSQCYQKKAANPYAVPNL